MLLNLVADSSSDRSQNLIPEELGARQHDTCAENQLQFSGVSFWRVCHGYKNAVCGFLAMQRRLGMLSKYQLFDFPTNNQQDYCSLGLTGVSFYSTMCIYHLS